MAPIITFVFLDLETTGFPKEELNKTKITELSLVAVKRSHILETQPGDSPRVQHKLTLCFNPRRIVQPASTSVTGLCNDLLEHESPFDRAAFDTIHNFLSLLTKPVCLIAHNGFTYDFPILKKHLIDLNVNLSGDILCADCLHCFYDIDTKLTRTCSNVPLEEKTHLDGNTDDQNLIKDMKKQNESTPKKCNSSSTINTNAPRKRKHNIGPRELTKVRRPIFFDGDSKPQKSYKLKYIYERYLNRCATNAHRAENDCIMALECSVAKAEKFVQWVDNNHCKFADVKPMTIGVPLGLLVLTGVLWGCTNPFIRLATKGLRRVHADSRLGQAYAEIVFLLGNWRYVLPWLLNQTGSLVYLAAVQRAPLSLAVPAANGLAFVFTAVTGAVVGTEEPLDLGSYLGIILIGAGTALCCWDQTQ